MAESKFADDTAVQAVHLMTPELANPLGNIHGGHVARLADNLAFVCASRFAGTPCVTAAMDRVDYFEPVHIGDALNLEARICYAGRTSLEVEVEAYCENLGTGQKRHTTSCSFTFVALKDGKPAPVPRLVPRARADKARYLRAKARRDMGLRYREDRQGLAAQFDDMDDAKLDALIAQDGAKSR
jgi:uncharacterized protein (TIGR00369 family)